MKVKFIDHPYWSADLYGSELEALINDFIQDKKVIDIKYQSHNQSALIMYEDEKETADKPVVERLKQGKANLDGKIRKLKAFLYDDEKLSNIEKEQVKLSQLRLETMEQYSDVLFDLIVDLEE